MPDQLATSVLDAAQKSADASFPLARRGGYDSDAVDSFARTQSTELQRAAEALKSAEDENVNLRSLIEKLKDRVEAVEKPTYTGLGNHAAQLLGLAEQEAEDVRMRSVRDAEELVKKAEEEAALVRAEAVKAAEETKARGITEIDDRRKALLEEVEVLNAETKAHTADQRAHAEREAAQMRLAAEQESQNMRLGATREVEQARAAADREVTEARRVLAVEKERLAREATESHEAASQQTAQLVADAESRAAAADDRARDVMAQAAKARDAASDEATRMLGSAKNDANALMTGAQADAEHLRASATTDSERQTRMLRSEVEDLQRKRDGIMSQMGQLRDIVSTFAPEAVQAVAIEGNDDTKGESTPAPKAVESEVATDDTSDDTAQDEVSADA